jgi:hypothetical protein
MLDKLRELDQLVHGAYYDMGRILSAIAHGKLSDILGYESLGDMIDEELSFSRSQGYRYLHTYRNFRRLGYNKTEALDLINEFSFTYMSKYLPTAQTKVGKRAIRNAIEKLLDKARQINFQLNSTDLLLLVEALRIFGAEPKEGRLLHSSSALMDMVRSVLDD